MKILLTGASGFIGKNFLELSHKNVEITAIYNSSIDIVTFVKEKKLNNVTLHKCNLTDKTQVKLLFKKIGNKFDYCLYLAGNVDVPLSMENQITDYKGNVVALLNFLQSCNKIKRFIYMSSGAVYDGISGNVTVENKLNPGVPYAISKLAAEQYVKFFCSIGKLEQYVILRFGGAFGLYSRSSKFLGKLVREIAVENKEVIEIYGDGTNIINEMYVKDVVKALFTVLKSEKSNIISNLGQENMTLTETVERVAKIFNKKVKIKYTPKREDQKYIHFYPKIDFYSVFDFQADYSFEQGIIEFGQLLRNQLRTS